MKNLIATVITESMLQEWTIWHFFNFFESMNEVSKNKNLKTVLYIFTAPHQGSPLFGIGLHDDTAVEAVERLVKRCDAV